MWDIFWQNDTVLLRTWFLYVTRIHICSWRHSLFHGIQCNVSICRLSANNNKICTFPSSSHQTYTAAKPPKCPLCIYSSFSLYCKISYQMVEVISWQANPTPLTKIQKSRKQMSHWRPPNTLFLPQSDG